MIAHIADQLVILCTKSFHSLLDTSDIFFSIFDQPWCLGLYKLNLKQNSDYNSLKCACNLQIPLATIVLCKFVLINIVYFLAAFSKIKYAAL